MPKTDDLFAQHGEREFRRIGNTTEVFVRPRYRDHLGPWKAAWRKTVPGEDRIPDHVARTFGLVA